MGAGCQIKSTLGAAESSHAWTVEMYRVRAGLALMSCDVQTFSISIF